MEGNASAGCQNAVKQSLTDFPVASIRVAEKLLDDRCPLWPL